MEEENWRAGGGFRLVDAEVVDGDVLRGWHGDRSVAGFSGRDVRPLRLGHAARLMIDRIFPGRSASLESDPHNVARRACFVFTIATLRRNRVLFDNDSRRGQIGTARCRRTIRCGEPPKALRHWHTHNVGQTTGSL